MTITELVKKLQEFHAEHGDLEVLMFDPSEGTIRDCDEPVVRVAQEDQYPSDWNMPPGFTFVRFSP
jgi:hypothetical protein